MFTTCTNLSQFFVGTTPVLGLYVWANENPKAETGTRKSNWGPYDCIADALS